MLLLFIELSTSFSWCSLPTNIRTLLLLYSSGYWRFPVLWCHTRRAKMWCWCPVTWWWESVSLLGLSGSPRLSVIPFIQARIPLFHSAWHRWCVVTHLAALPVNLTRHLVSCPLQIPTWLTFFLVTSKLPSWVSSPHDRSPVASWIVLGFPSVIWWHLLSVFSWDIHL